MRRASGKKMVGLVEASEADQNRAACQIAAYTGYLKGCHRGKGPTLWELAYRNADTIGSLKGYADASNMLLSTAPEFDLHRTGPLHGDLRTHSVKRKMNFGSGVGPQDSHRHDRVLRTSPNTRGFQKRAHPLVQDVSNDSAPPPVTSVPPPLSSGFSAPPVKAFDDTVTLSSSSDDVQIIEPFRRPETRSQSGIPEPCPQQQQHVNIPAARPRQFYVQEVVVQVRSWHLRRSTNRGTGPTCNGSLRNTPASRDLCKNRIHAVGLSDRRGVVGIMIGGERLAGLNQWPARLWFCPNNHCHVSRGNRGIGPLPPPPSVLPVVVGTNLSQREIQFLLEQGIKLQGLHTGEAPVDSSSAETVGIPSSLDLRINVDEFPEKVLISSPDYRHSRRNGRVCRIRSTDSSAHLSRVVSATREIMRIVAQRQVHHGNGTGKQFCIATHEHDNLPPKRYWVQICCFPSCSCDDFFRRHTRGKSYQACKHIYWVYKNVGRLDLTSSFIVKQPILSLTEVQSLLR